MSRTPPKKFFDAARLQALQERAGFRSEAAMMKAAGLKVGNTKVWATKSGPTAENALQLASFLGVSLQYLYGEQPAEARARLARELQLDLGQAEADVIDAMGSLDEKSKGEVVGFAKALAIRGQKATAGLDPEVVRQAAKDARETAMRPRPPRGAPPPSPAYDEGIYRPAGAATTPRPVEGEAPSEPLQQAHGAGARGRRKQ